MKAELRERARAARKAIPAGVRREKEARIRERLLALPEVARARTIAAYVGIHSEVDTRVLIEELLMAGVEVAAPVQTSATSMRFARLESLGDLASGRRGIPEPRPPHAFLDEADVILVPGLAFAPDGARLGNGGGHYDRLLEHIPRARRVALAYDEQVAPELPREAHDVPMDVIVTDARTILCPPRAT